MIMNVVVVNILQMHSVCSYSFCGRVFAVYPKFLNFSILSLLSFGVLYDFSFVPSLEVNAQRQSNAVSTSVSLVLV